MEATLMVNPEETIRFEQGLWGFEDIKEYVLLQDTQVPAVMTFQAVGVEYPSFVVVEPRSFFSGYHPVLSKGDAAYFKQKTVDQLTFLALVVLHSDINQTVVNLKSPIVVDPDTRKARQVILENLDYPIRFPLFQGQAEGEISC